ncbi:DUF6318 family protein [Promicromonospora sp. NPDC059942]|uniref:DUF6318 family protein n=1 Tax=Promicromonospora sp. NPDC059942 TaxID=3347009 RepID=UPI00365ECF20
MSGMVMRAAGLIVTAGLALTGCTGSPPDPEASSAPSGVSTPAASASPSPSLPAKPERPEAMKRKDAEGAAAAAEYFIELYPYVMATGDTEEFEAMSHRACGFCEQAIKDAERIQDQDRLFQGGTTEVKILDRFAQDDLTGIYPLDVEVHQALSETLAADGSVVSSAEAQVSAHRVEVGRKDGHWVVVAIAPRPKS